jgi:DNA-directed RNA polymerase subunit E'/Rpb7|tara:strand:+ start:576 stop:1061 length:486 start_codon:yes stop_codon:yes gene_type:complete
MDSNIYTERLIEKTISINFNELTKNLDELLLKKLRFLYENKCNESGFIKKDSIELIKRTNGYISQYYELSNIQFNIIFKCNICNPSPDLTVECKIIEVIKPGIIAELFPLSIIVPIQLHSNKKIFSLLEIGQMITVKIMDSKFKKNEKEIQAVAMLVDDNK